MRVLLTQCFRGYAAVGALGAVLTALLAFGVVDISLSALGYGWLGVAALGAVVGLGILTNKETVLEADTSFQRLETFEETVFTGRPLDAYIVALGAWAAVSVGWVLGGMSTSGLTVVGYGWLSIAAYGAFVGIGIVLNHREDVRTAIDPTDTLETGGGSRLR